MKSMPLLPSVAARQVDGGVVSDWRNRAQPCDTTRFTVVELKPDRGVLGRGVFAGAALDGPAGQARDSRTRSVASQATP